MPTNPSDTAKPAAPAPAPAPRPIRRFAVALMPVAGRPVVAISAKTA